MAHDGSTRPPGLRRIDPTGALAELPGAAAGGAVVLLGRAWAGAVGEAVAAHSGPARVTGDGTLLVHCSSSTWVSELELMAGVLARRLQEALGEEEPRRLRFRVGPMPRRPDEDRAPRPPREVDPATRAQAARLAVAVTDDALRAAVERAIASRLARPAVELADRRGGPGEAPEPEGRSDILDAGSEAWRHPR